MHTQNFYPRETATPDTILNDSLFYQCPSVFRQSQCESQDGPTNHKNSDDEHPWISLPSYRFRPHACCKKGTTLAWGKNNLWKMNFSLLLQVDLSDGSRGGFVVSCLSCFGGGVILTTALTHMLPEVNLFLQYNIQQGQLIDRVRIFKNQHCPEWRNKQIFFPIQNFRVGHWLRSGFSVVSSWSTLSRRFDDSLQTAYWLSSGDPHTGSPEKN